MNTYKCQQYEPVASVADATSTGPLVSLVCDAKFQILR